VIKIEKSIDIEKNAVDVWNTLTVFSGYRGWNPVVKHAAIYGPVAPGTGIKALVGKWDFEFTIVKTRPPEEFELRGSSIGINLKLCFNINNMDGGSKVRLNVRTDGWISTIFKNRVKSNLEETLEIFLKSLKRKVLEGSYEIKRDDTEQIEPESDSISMPTPFNLIYRTRAKKSRRGGLR
jgi:hypothetical protein